MSEANAVRPDGKPIHLVHFVYSRWDRWTACGISKQWFRAEFGTRNRRTTGVLTRITCPRCLRVVGEH